MIHADKRKMRQLGIFWFIFIHSKKTKYEIEPGSTAWKAAMLTTLPLTHTFKSSGEGL